jgi:alpha-tubulin suppressor-like RCC1 family protein
LRSVSLDDDLACGLRSSDQSVYCWGFSPYGTNLPTTSGPFEAISVGDRLACGVRADHTAACWGDSALLARLPSSLTGVAQICARSGGACVRHTDGSIACFGFANYASATIPEPNKDFMDVTCGDALACGLRSDGRAECWGQSSLLGSLTPADATERFTDLDAGKDYACGLHADGSVGCWGRNYNGQAPRTRTATFSLH